MLKRQLNRVFEDVEHDSSLSVCCATENRSKVLQYNPVPGAGSHSQSHLKALLGGYRTGKYLVITHTLVPRGRPKNLRAALSHAREPSRSPMGISIASIARWSGLFLKIDGILMSSTEVPRENHNSYFGSASAIDIPPIIVQLSAFFTQV